MIKQFSVPRQCEVFHTPLGWIAFDCDADGAVRRLTFGQATAAAAEADLATRPAEGPAGDLPPAAAEWRELIERYAAGEPVDLTGIPLNFGRQTPFGRRVIAACRRIAYGQTLTYAQLATRAGSPGAARAVGQAMACNRLPLLVPCHRVVASGGGLGGYTAPGGLAMKRRLLELERAR